MRGGGALSSFGLTRLLLLVAFVLIAGCTYLYADTTTLQNFLLMVSCLGPWVVRAHAWGTVLPRPGTKPAAAHRSALLRVCVPLLCIIDSHAHSPMNHCFF